MILPSSSAPTPPATSSTEGKVKLTGDLGGTAASPQVVAFESATTSINVASATAPTAGQVLTATSSTAATWQAASGGGVIRATTGGLTWNGGVWNPLASGTAYFSLIAGNYLAFQRGASIGGHMILFLNGAGGGYPNWDSNPTLTTIFSGGSNDAGQSYLAYVVIDQAGFGTLPQTQKYAGFKLACTSGTLSLAAVHCDGTNAEVSTSVSVSSFTDSLTGVVNVTSGSKIDFYFNGSLVATHTTNLPSGAFENGYLSVSASGTVGTTDEDMINMVSLALSYDVS